MATMIGPKHRQIDPPLSGTLRITYDQHGILASCDVIVAGKVVAWLPITTANLKTGAQRIGEWEIGIEMCCTQVVHERQEGPTCLPAST